ncbi:hypothetical protein WOLCODRAFT_135267 [Wolfiporia cocos MD-104 SS10]|uniref:Uncharacterized protein n=1 Tax=Wolfiporia cocos (strain MD-104) TaxID=742152 RepID=A0A2H3J7S0_WOLCO|nr:hypothetical protein WOLCODRAFT_135267 [Wolfiporia cocos MD-104 SS10]
MSMPPGAARRPLNYFQQSPVRGQLELPDAVTAREGWRFLQCTDTPNELRVLLPPRTAAIYGHLLQAEASELVKADNASWERILRLRHLKDRMIRKCQRLARSSAPAAGKQPARALFVTYHAPPDFRMKEMERWFREEGIVLTRSALEGAGAPSPSCCANCEPWTRPPVQQPPQMTRRTSASQRVVMSERTQVTRTGMSSRGALSGNPPASLPHTQRPPPRRLSPEAHRNGGRVSGGMRDPSAHPPTRQRSVEHRRLTPPNVATQPQVSAARADLVSPDPLPIIFRTSIPIPDSPPTIPEQLPAAPQPQPDPPHPTVLMPQPEPAAQPELSPLALDGPVLSTMQETSGGQSISVVVETVTEETDYHTLTQQRSSLKRSSSMNGLSQCKSVAWAMDRDWIEQMDRYTKAVGDTDMLDRELEELRQGYRREVETMRALCRNVAESSERIRIEMERMHKDEEAVRRHEDRLLHTVGQLEQKERQFREKGTRISLRQLRSLTSGAVTSVLEETKQVVQLCDKKREHE